MSGFAPRAPVSASPSAVEDGSDPRTLVSTAWLAANLKAPDLRILDASWYMPATGRNGRAEYERGHIPGARFFDIDEIADQRSGMPHTVAPVEKFMSRMRALGVGDGHRTVVYDGTGLFSAARVWWNMRLMGQRDVAVLDGGLPKWVAEGHKTTTAKTAIRDRHMIVERQDAMISDVTQVARASKLGDHTIIDARSPGRFTGAEAEPREGMRSGHIPGSRNVPYAGLLNADGTMKDAGTLRAIFEGAGVDLAKPAITTCGSGVTAGILGLALTRIGKEDWAVYDGSWSEWGMYGDLPIETGPAT